jgi:hypothetical protein
MIWKVNIIQLQYQINSYKLNVQSILCKVVIQSKRQGFLVGCTWGCLAQEEMLVTL